MYSNKEQSKYIQVWTHPRSFSPLSNKLSSMQTNLNVQKVS